MVFTAKGKFPERLINLAMLSDIAIINPVGGKGQLTAQVSVADYKALYNIRRQTMTGLKINKKVGLLQKPPPQGLGNRPRFILCNNKCAVNVYMEY